MGPGLFHKATCLLLLRHEQRSARVILWLMTLAPNIRQLPDEDLMLLVANGVIEHPATELFRRHNHALYNFMAWMCQGNTHEAEDVTQKTWIKIMSKSAAYQPSAAFRTYLYHIAHHTWLDGRTQRYETQRETLDDHVDIPSEGLNPEIEWQIKKNLQLVRLALMQLPSVQREVIVLRFFNEMSLEEIALTIGEGFETVKSRLRYAYSKLRRELEASHG